MRIAFLCCFAAALLEAVATCRALADAGTLTIRAVVLTRSNCRFQTVTSTVNFGTLDPSIGADITTSATFRFRCGGSAPTASFVISHDSGQNESSPGFPRMRHQTAAGEYLPYQLSLSPASGTVPRNVNQTLTATGTVRSVNFWDARAGSYSDFVTLTILP